MTQIIKDIAYVADAPDVRNKLDLYLPDGDTRRPLILWVHGGGWREGDKCEMPLINFLGDDIAIASMNYRYVDNSKGLPGMLAPALDVASAARFLASASDEYGFDMERFVVAGFSAGAHLVGMVALGGDELPGSSGPPLRGLIRGVVAMGGVYDFKTMPRNELYDYLVVAGIEIAEQQRIYSPVTYITPEAPPFYIQHGLDDDRVSPSQSEAFAAALKAAGVPYEIELVPNLAHKIKINNSMRANVLRLLGKQGARANV